MTTNFDHPAEVALRAAARATPRIQTLIAATQEARAAWLATSAALAAVRLEIYGPSNPHLRRAAPMARIKDDVQRARMAAASRAACTAEGRYQDASRAEGCARVFLTDAMRAKAIADGTYDLGLN